MLDQCQHTQNISTTAANCEVYEYWQRQQLIIKSGKYTDKSYRMLDQHTIYTERHINEAMLQDTLKIQFDKKCTMTKNVKLESMAKHNVMAAR